tara:strand:- start:11208 stop:11594 length:387 start_codon:yes stop_codon:yes gene_type:complete
VSSYGNILGIHENALLLREQRLKFISENIANSETPHYKAKDIDFKSAMSASSRQYLEIDKTNTKHLGATANSDNHTIYRYPVNAPPDGNTVELHHQQSEFGKESGRYLATLQFIENRVGGIRRALKGE